MPASEKFTFELSDAELKATIFSVQAALDVCERDINIFPDGRWKNAATRALEKLEALVKPKSVKIQ